MQLMMIKSHINPKKLYLIVNLFCYDFLLIIRHVLTEWDCICNYK